MANSGMYPEQFIYQVVADCLERFRIDLMRTTSNTMSLQAKKQNLSTKVQSQPRTYSVKPFYSFTQLHCSTYTRIVAALRLRSRSLIHVQARVVQNQRGKGAVAVAIKVDSTNGNDHN